MGFQVNTSLRKIGGRKADTARLPGSPIPGDRHQVVIPIKVIFENT